LLKIKKVDDNTNSINELNELYFRNFVDFLYVPISCLSDHQVK